MDPPKLTAVKVVVDASTGVGELILAHHKLNMIDGQMLHDFHAASRYLHAHEDVRVILLHSRDRCFSSGIDFSYLAGLMERVAAHSEDVARRAVFFGPIIDEFQKQLGVFGSGPKPTVAVAHSYCLGAALELFLQADVRLCAADAVFSCKEVQMGLAPDIGALALLPRSAASASFVYDRALTSEDFTAADAKRAKLVSHVGVDYKATMSRAHAICKIIGARSPVAMQATKRVLRASFDGQSTQANLGLVADLNQVFLCGEDTAEAVQAKLQKRSPSFSKL